ncbi:hypothetical protein MLD52_19420 [Puniceicoccaceae bacterium K14]|nr:hypothetical protein [Puniceicoccaceae bacterium K14]
MKSHKICITAMVLFSSLFSASLSADTVNSSTHREHDFDNNSIVPFLEDQGFTGSAISGEGMSFTNSSTGGLRLKLTWKESEYDGSRRERGHELKANVVDDKEIFTGFHWRIPSGQSNNILNKNTIIWQLYCWNSAGCSNWTAHVELKSNDDLYLNYRAACVSSTEVKIYDNVSTNTDHAFQIRARASGQGNGRIDFKRNGSFEHQETNISFGFGSWSNDEMADAVIGVKMGMYCFDTSNYSNNEVRILYLDNLGSCVRTGSVGNSYNLIDPRNY